MLIAGAGGLAAQLFDDLICMNTKNYIFWSETETTYQCLKDNFKILNNDKQVTEFFSHESKLFVVGIWDIVQRKRLIEKFKKLGGELTTFISPQCYFSSYTTVKKGSIIMHKASSEPDVIIGENCIINKRANFDMDVLYL